MNPHSSFSATTPYVRISIIIQLEVVTYSVQNAYVAVFDESRSST